MFPLERGLTEREHVGGGNERLTQNGEPLSVLRSAVIPADFPSVEAVPRAESIVSHTERREEVGASAFANLGT